jgi:hypothetical protein
MRSRAVQRIGVEQYTRTADTVLYALSRPGVDVGILSLSANDSDFFKIRLRAGDFLTAATFPT